MRNLPVSIAAALILALGSAAAAEQVEIPSGDVKLRAMLFRPERRRPISGDRGPAYLRRPGRRRIADRSALPGMGRAPEGRRFRRAVSRQFRLARAGLAMPPAPARRARLAHAHQRRHRRPPLAAGAALGDRRPGVAARLVAWRHHRVVDGAPPRRRRARQDAGFPLGGGALSELPALRQLGLERAHPDPDPDRARRRLDAGRDLRADGRRRARTQRRRADRGLSGRLSRFRPSPIWRCTSAPASPIRRARPAACISAPTRTRAPTPSSACRSGSRADP